jgi:hypothetical protein
MLRCPGPIAAVVFPRAREAEIVAYDDADRVVEERAVKAPVPGVAAPTETKLASPAAVMFQLSSAAERVFEVSVMVSAAAPIKISSAPASFIVTFPVAERVVNAPLFGVPDPIVPGAAHVAPIKLDAFIVPVPE